MPPRIGPLKIAEIQRAVAEHFGLAVEEMLSSRRRPARPRQVAYYLARELTPDSLPQIGKAFHRDHTTVLHGIIVIERALLGEPDLAAAVVGLRRALVESALVDVGDDGPGPVDGP